MRQKLSRFVDYLILGCFCICFLPALFFVASLIRLDDLRLERKWKVTLNED